MNSISVRLSNFLENAFTKAFNKGKNEDTSDSASNNDNSVIYENIQEYKDAGYHFRRTKTQMDRGLTREEAFTEFMKNKKKA